MSRGHVVLDALAVRPRPTGVSRSILELTRALAAAGSDLRFTVLATYPELFPHLATAEAWQVVPCAEARDGLVAKTAFVQGRLPDLLRRLRADLLHSLQFLAPLRSPCPLVVTVHDLAFRSLPVSVPEPRRSLYRLLVPRVLRRAAAVVTNSTATAEEVAAHFPEAKGRVRVTPFGTPSWVWERAAAEPHQPRPGDGEARAPFLFVGTLEPRKNIAGLLAGYELYRRRVASGRGHSGPRPLVLVGGNALRDRRLLRKLHEMHDDGSIKLAGYAATDRLWEYYRSARALLYPSLHEGFGFPILEAMVAGLPVVTSARGGMAEVAGEAALLVEPEDPTSIVAGIERIESDEPLRVALVERGRRRARVWDWGETARATLAVYREVLDDSPGRADRA